jgi:hypothetical protein
LKHSELFCHREITGERQIDYIISFAGSHDIYICIPVTLTPFAALGEAFALPAPSDLSTAELLTAAAIFIFRFSASYSLLSSLFTFSTQAGTSSLN